MQKLDFTEYIKTLVVELKSVQFGSTINNIKETDQISVTHRITSLIIQSKSKYDVLRLIPEVAEILAPLDAEDIYSEDAITQLIDSVSVVSTGRQPKVNLFLSARFLPFYCFHNNLVAVSKLCENVLAKDLLTEVHEEDVVMFRVVVEESLKIEEYTKILATLSNLIETIQQAVNMPVEEPKLILLDSGSDTNFGVKTKIAKSLFEIFKEVWDWMVNRKFYRGKLRDEAFMQQLTALNALKETADNGAIDETAAKGFREIITRRIEDLLEAKVIPKDLFQLQSKKETQKVLSEFGEQKLIENKPLANNK